MAKNHNASFYFSEKFSLDIGLKVLTDTHDISVGY